MAALRIACLLSALAVSPAMAACPQELAVYQGVDGIGALEFVGGGAGMFSEMRLLYPGVEPVTIYLSHDEELDRSVAMIPLNCPEGDVTGAELAACLVYEGAVYVPGGTGGTSSLPDYGADAARTVLLPNLASALWGNPQFGEAGPEQRPADLFKLSGCQE